MVSREFVEEPASWILGDRAWSEDLGYSQLILIHGKEPELSPPHIECRVSSCLCLFGVVVITIL